MGPVTIWQKISAGIFVALITGVWLFFNITLSGEAEGRQYHVFIDQSVRGLAPSSLVCFNGIPVGKVLTIKNDFKRNKVRIDVLITDPGVKVSADITPNDKKGNIKEEVQEGTRGQLVTYLFTGLQYIDLNGGYETYPDLKEGEEIPIIKTGFQAKVDEFLSDENRQHIQNIITNLDNITYNLNQTFFESDGNSLTSKVSDILTNVERISGEESNEKIQKILLNLDQLSSPEKLGIQALVASFQENSEKLFASGIVLFDKLNRVIDSQGEEKDVASLVKNLNAILEDNQRQIGGLMKNLEELSLNANLRLNQLSKRFDTTIQTVNHFLQKELYQTNADAKSAFKELSHVLQILKARPNALLWGAGVKGK